MYTQTQHHHNMKVGSILTLVGAVTASLELDLRSYTPSESQAATLKAQKRSSIGVEVDRQLAYYEATLSLGTPPQNLTFLLDTGSSDLWVLSKNVTCLPKGFHAADSWNGVNCSLGGMFDSLESSSFRLNTSANAAYKPGNKKTWPFQISYGDSSAANGLWAVETLTVGGQKVANFDFGYAQNASSGLAVLGIGPAGNEASTDNSPSWTYDNLPHKLKSEGITSSTAYSLWLNSQQSTKGSIMFGGYDRAKIHGDLFTLPLVPTVNKETVTEFAVELEAVRIDGKHYGSKSTVVLDSGTTMTLLPKEQVEPIIKMTGANYSTEVNSYIFNCSDSPKGGTVDFVFADKLAITVQLTDLFSVLRYNDGSADTYVDGTLVCVVNLQVASKKGPSILGASFLRSAYVVYDIDNSQVSLGNAKFNISDSDIVNLGPLGVGNLSREREHTSEGGERVGVSKWWLLLGLFFL